MIIIGILSILLIFAVAYAISLRVFLKQLLVDIDSYKKRKICCKAILGYVKEELQIQLGLPFKNKYHIDASKG